jgi:hypothetical protein
LGEDTVTRRQRWLLIALSIGLCLPALAPARADVIEEPGEQPPPRRRTEPAPEKPLAPAPAVTPAEPEGWQFSVLPYFWWSGVDGELEVPLAATPPPRDSLDADLDVGWWEPLGSDDDVNLTASGGALMEARKGKIGLFLHPAGGSIESEEDFDEFDESDTEIDAIWLEGGLAYRLMESGDPGKQLYVDALAGVRWTHLDTEVDIRRGDATTLLPEGMTRSDEHDFVDPFVGGRVRLPLAEHLGFYLEGDVGGFSVGSSLSWQVMTGLGYQLDLGGLSPELFIGYRALDQDYERGDFEWDTTVHGPVFGVGLNF